MSLLVTGVLGDKVEVLSSDDDGSVHLGGNDGAGQDTATDGDEAGEGALLVYRVKVLVMRSQLGGIFWLSDLREVRSNACPFSRVLLNALHLPKCFPRSNIFHLPRTDVAALNGGLGGTETQADVLVPSSATLARSGALGSGLRVLEDVRLLLESTLRLDGQLGRPDAEVSDAFVRGIVYRSLLRL